MALVKCPECGNEVSDSAVMCPHCGYNVKENFCQVESKTTENTVKIEKEITGKHYSHKKRTFIAFAILILMVVLVFWGRKFFLYNRAVNYYGMNEWKLAIEVFENLGNFFDSEELLNKAKIELAADDYELGVYAYEQGDFATSLYVLNEAYYIYPEYTGVEEQRSLSEFMNVLQGKWSCADQFFIEVEGFKARIKDINCKKYSDYCRITPYKDTEGYWTIKIIGDVGNRSWEFKYKKGTKNPKAIESTDFLGYPSNTGGIGMYFVKD